MTFPKWRTFMLGCLSFLFTSLALAQPSTRPTDVSCYDLAADKTSVTRFTLPVDENGRRNLINSDTTFDPGQFPISIGASRERENYRLVKLDPNGSALNQLAVAVFKGVKTKGTRVGVTEKNVHGALYYADKNLIVVGDLHPAVIAHEIMHVYLKTLWAQAEVGILAGFAGQSLEELLTYPLTIKLLNPEAAFATTKMYFDDILLNTTDGTNFPARASQNLVQKFIAGTERILISDMGPETTFTFLDHPSDSISIGSYDQANKLVYVRIRQEGLVELAVIFTASDAIEFIESICKEIYSLQNQSSDRAQLVFSANSKARTFFEMTALRLNQTAEVHEEISDITRQLLNELKSGADAKSTRARLLHSVRDAKAKYTYPKLN